MSRVLIAGSVKMVLSVRADHLPAPGETVPGQDEWLWESGGKGLNQAVAASRAGAEVSLVGRVGEDLPGDQIIEFLHENQISTELLSRSSTKPTGMSCVWVDRQSGENSIVSSGGATAELAASNLPQIDFADKDILVSQFSAPVAYVEAFFAAGKASQKSLTTILNAAPAKELPPALLKNVNILVVNEGEASSYLEQNHLPPFNSLDLVSTTMATHQLRDAFGVDVLVVTLGELGLVAVTKQGETFQILSLQVKTLDTTGAGDCFLGNLAARLSQGDDLEKALNWANTASALSVQKIGAAVSMPFAADTESCMPVTAAHVL